MWPQYLNVKNMYALLSRHYLNVKMCILSPVLSFFFRNVNVSVPDVCRICVITKSLFCCGSALTAGSNVLRVIPLDKEVEIAAIERKSVVVTANSESFLIRLSTPEGTLTS